MNSCIAVVDSGVGGLDILNVLKDNLINECFIFVGDNANVPFGTKTKEELEVIGIRLAKYLEKQDVKMIVLACNTLSLNAIDAMREAIDIPIYGIARPTVKGFLNHEKKSVLVLATSATISSHRYVDFLNELDSSVKVYEQAAPKLVEYIEANQLECINQALKEYIDPYIKKIDAVILGCTHYPIINSYISELYPDLLIIDSRKPMVKLINDKLDFHNIRASKENKQEIIIQATGSKEALKKASEHFFDYSKVELIERGINHE